MEALADSRTSCIIKDISSYDHMTLYDDECGQKNQMTYDDIESEVCIQPKYSYTHYGFNIC